MPETKREEHRRLQERTDALKHDHEDLSRDRTPFNQADHDRHTEDLRKHKTELVKHQRRENDPAR